MATPRTPRKRVPVPHYSVVPQSPAYGGQPPAPSMNPNYPQMSRTTSEDSHGVDPRAYNGYNGQPDPTAQGVFTGHIGGGFGPYAYHQNTEQPRGAMGQSRFSAPPSDASHSEKQHLGPPPQTNALGTAFLWDSRDPDLDDALHNPDPRQNAVQDAEWTLFSLRGWANYGTLFILGFGLFTLFCGYPIISHYTRHSLEKTGFNLGGINLTGQVPDLPGLPNRIDRDTPEDAYTRVGNDGWNYNLVFSDEFNTPGRTFYPGDDPWWEAMDFHYWPTVDIQWYDPGQAMTRDGALVITMVQERNHDMNFKSAMLQSWNKFCFTGGYIEVSILLPGSHEIPGFWPGAWTMGNLGRAGYGATTEGMWPYSYDECDYGAFPNQTDRNGNPALAATGNAEQNGPISFLPGQRTSSCTCPDSDHPGPRHDFGRAAPEIDILEAQIDVIARRGQVSQSCQIAPFDYAYEFPTNEPVTTIYDSEITVFNTYKGGVFQQAISGLSYIPDRGYQDSNREFVTYGFEYWPSRGDDGFITWYMDGKPTWTMTTATLAPNPQSEVGQRLIPEEPMYMVLNFGMAPGFQQQDFDHLVFPNEMHIDYVRVYQREDEENFGCDPPSHPTAKYIEDHINAYSNPNLTIWSDAGYSFPRNSVYDGC